VLVGVGDTVFVGGCVGVLVGVSVAVGIWVGVTVAQLPVLVHAAFSTGVPPGWHCPFTGAPQADWDAYSQQLFAGSGVFVGVGVGDSEAGTALYS